MYSHTRHKNELVPFVNYVFMWYYFIRFSPRLCVSAVKKTVLQTLCAAGRAFALTAKYRYTAATTKKTNGEAGTRMPARRSSV